MPAKPAPVLVDVVAGAIHWKPELAAVRATASSSGRCILVASTKPGCSLCEKFMKEVAPKLADEVNKLAATYAFDITAPEDEGIDRLLRKNLAGARLMPLVGFVTPDGLWIHGFWGGQSPERFAEDLRVVRALLEGQRPDAMDPSTAPSAVEGPAASPSEEPIEDDAGSELPIQVVASSGGISLVQLRDKLYGVLDLRTGRMLSTWHSESSACGRGEQLWLSQSGDRMYCLDAGRLRVLPILPAHWAQEAKAWQILRSLTSEEREYLGEIWSTPPGR